MTNDRRSSRLGPVISTSLEYIVQLRSYPSVTDMHLLQWIDKFRGSPADCREYVAEMCRHNGRFPEDYRIVARRLIDRVVQPQPGGSEQRAGDT